MGAIIFAREENRNAGCGEGFDGFQQDARETHYEVPVMVETSGLCPTRNSYFTENEWSEAPLEDNIFPRTSGRTPFAELHILGENCPQVSAFLYFVGIFIHSIYGFYKKRVGITPLEMPIFGENEWGKL